MIRLTESELAERKANVIERLGRNPDLTKWHFVKNFGYSPDFIHGLEKDGVVFGMKKKPKPITLGPKCRG